MTNKNDIFFIKKSPSSHSKPSLIQQNISILANMNKSSQNFHQETYTSFYPLSNVLNPTNQTFFYDQEQSIKDNETEKHLTNSSFIFFPAMNENESFSLDILNTGPKHHPNSRTFNRQASMRSFFRQSSLNSRPPNNFEEEMYLKLSNNNQPQQEETKNNLKPNPIDLVIHKELNIFHHNNNNNNEEVMSTRYTNNINVVNIGEASPIMNNKHINNKTLFRKKSLKRKNSRRIYKCEHMNCGLSFKTLKQKLNHHKKMCKECKKDTIIMLKTINKLKVLIKELRNSKHINDNFPEHLQRSYQDKLKSRTLEGYAQIFVGLDINDVVSSNLNDKNNSSDNNSNSKLC